MKHLKKEIKYSVNEEEISVVLDSVWPVAFIDTNNYELIDYVLKDINNKYLTDNGAFIILENENEKIKEILKNNNYEFFSMTCLLDEKEYNNDIKKYECNCEINDEVKQYYSYNFNKLTGLDNGEKLLDISSHQASKKFYIFYEKNKIVGMLETRTIHDNISIRQVFSDSKETMKFMLKFLSSKIKLDITIECDRNNKLLVESLNEMSVKILCSRYVFKISK